jgi:outer membrane protein TolC
MVFCAMSQREYQTILQQVEENNTALNVLRQRMKSQKLNNRTGIFPSNPEVEFNYLWGSPKMIGNRVDLSVKQSFDFPTVYSHRNKIAALQNNNVECTYQIERLDLLLGAKQICIKLIYYNTLDKMYEKRLDNAKLIADAYRFKWETGETNILEYNKAQLNLLSVQTEKMRIKTEQTTLLAQLKGLNGGKEIAFSDDLYPDDTLPVDFEQWYLSAEENNPILQYVYGQIEIDKQQLKLNRALSLPKFSAGYMNEKVRGEQFQGLKLSMTVPFWEHKNNVKQAKAQLTFSESSLEDGKIQFYNRLKNVYAKAFVLEKNIAEIKRSMSLYSNESLIKKALDAGEISLLNYIQEINYYYEVMNMLLETERDFKLTVSELFAVEL